MPRPQHHTLLSTVLAALLLLARPGLAQDLAPSLDDLIARALAQSPSLVAPEARIEAAQARIGPAGSGPDPMLMLSAAAMGLDPPGPSSQVVMEWQQELPGPGKLRTRRAEAESMVAMERGRQGVSVADVVETVRALYARIYAADRELAALDAADRWLALLQGVQGNRLGGDQGTSTEWLRTELERGRLRRQRAAIEAERSATLAPLNRLLGRSPEEALGRIPALPAITLPEHNQVLARAEQGPDLVLAQAEREVAERRVEASRAEERPDFLVAGGGGVDGMQQPVLMVRLGMTLPVQKGRKQRAATQAAEAEQRVAEAELADRRSMLEAELSGLEAQWKAADAFLREQDGTILPGSKALIEAGLSDLAAGRGDYAMLIEDVRMWIEADMESAQAEMRRFLIWARLERLASAPESRP